MTQDEYYDRQFEVTEKDIVALAKAREQQRLDSKRSLEMQEESNAKGEEYRAEARAVNAELISLAQASNRLLEDIIAELQEIRTGPR